MTQPNYFNNPNHCRVSSSFRLKTKVFAKPPGTTKKAPKLPFSGPMYALAFFYYSQIYATDIVQGNRE